MLPSPLCAALSTCCVAVCCQGTSVSQDARFSDKQRSLLRSVTWPAVYRSELSAADLQRVRLSVLTPWIHQTLAALLGFEDEVVSSLVVNTLQQYADGKQAVDPRELQLTLTGFLEQAAGTFVEALWRLLVSAAREESGIPQQLIDSKVRDIQRQQQQSSSSTSGGTSGSSSGGVSDGGGQQQPSSASASVLQSASALSHSHSHSTPVPVASAAHFASVQSSRPHSRVRSRFGPPLSQTRTAAGTHTHSTAERGSEAKEEQPSPATGNTSTKRQRIAQ